MNPKIHILNSNLTKYREEIVNHALYKKLNSVEDIAVIDKVVASYISKE